MQHIAVTHQLASYPGLSALPKLFSFLPSKVSMCNVWTGPLTPATKLYAAPAGPDGYLYLLAADFLLICPLVFPVFLLSFALIPVIVLFFPFSLH